MTTFAAARQGDKVEICQGASWSGPYRIVDEPHVCDDFLCLALHCKGLDMDGRWVEPIRAYPDTQIHIVERGPYATTSELSATRSLAEHVRTEGAA